MCPGQKKRYSFTSSSSSTAAFNPQKWAINYQECLVLKKSIVCRYRGRMWYMFVFISSCWCIIFCFYFWITRKKNDDNRRRQIYFFCFHSKFFICLTMILVEVWPLILFLFKFPLFQIQNKQISFCVFHTPNTIYIGNLFSFIFK